MKKVNEMKIKVRFRTYVLTSFGGTSTSPSTGFAAAADSVSARTNTASIAAYKTDGYLQVLVLGLAIWGIRRAP
jgi:hypothetical protein